MLIRDAGFIVSGGCSGLGAATVRMLAEAGGRVMIADLDRDKGEAIAQEFAGSVSFVHTDVTSAGDGEAAVAAALETFGNLRGLVNCAGIAPAQKVIGRDGPHELENFARTINVNLVGSFNLLRLAANAIRDSEPDAEGERGVIVNTASIAAFDGQVGQAAYAASKGGIAAMTLPIARELARYGIRVMTIAPGVFETPMMAAMPEEVRHALGSSVPFPPRLGRPSEFAALVRQILENTMLNGEVIRLDGAIRMGAR
ncbi:3-hydroxyacyl-CoA dehydrogenase [Aliirhizobium cellulosilyticum]|uniref:NAD(P)-dependent dehydrogenase (Short-subunit alcohol dehydrogenase family) n=1 Tax=Aliirhizobium cellulosilyticum TaxID=393664 RepID=A0A7W6WQL5_9HYPH|nr:3-hydroxyacyl-CoA dehydrogenase [Rhizobium cellulosilyticum]MBB4349563.1 NAD(P)-dependent dehydrogenase (short-subunit alcohol dehydrogenase family) [Rhizobium cellulosilyticum]MBB4412215.1 NAD(P)-dependent dehydrogenase (short-subunit alcohol dehydrogenase family) [Rhizobium cellulosilyticum]MBB4446846.1 NAD(P)-dependent dehydrogenase (short-subunit alcohol dehydrogenase family) [Rhizobium cellulosilyticum]